MSHFLIKSTPFSPQWQKIALPPTSFSTPTEPKAHKKKRKNTRDTHFCTKSPLIWCASSSGALYSERVYCGCVWISSLRGSCRSMQISRTAVPRSLWRCNFYLVRDACIRGELIHSLSTLAAMARFALSIMIIMTCLMMREAILWGPFITSGRQRARVNYKCIIPTPVTQNAAPDAGAGTLHESVSQFCSIKIISLELQMRTIVLATQFNPKTFLVLSKIMQSIKFTQSILYDILVWDNASRHHVDNYYSTKLPLSNNEFQKMATTGIETKI